MGYRIGDREYDFNSNSNQRIKGKYVDRSVHANVTSMVSYILVQEDRAAPFEESDVENYYAPICPKCDSDNGFEEMEAYRCPICMEVYETEIEATACARCGVEEGYDTVDAHRCENCGNFVSEIEELDTRPQEVYEWWMVSDWLARELRTRGEVIIPHMNIWGRRGTGQAIMLDDVISSICHGMEILDGQRCSWEAA